MFSAGPCMLILGLQLRPSISSTRKGRRWGLLASFPLWLLTSGPRELPLPQARPVRPRDPALSRVPGLEAASRAPDLPSLASHSSKESGLVVSRSG